jgi:hypothetical protein
VKVIVDVAVIIAVLALLFILYTERGRGRVLYHQFCEKVAAWFKK